MLKSIKKTVLGCLSVLAVSVFIWVFLLLNPKFSYAHTTEFDQVTVFHNQELEANTEQIINDAIAILKTSELYNNEIQLQLCFNDGSYYPYLDPLVGGPLAYALLDKTIIKNSQPSFEKNIVEAQWAINDYEYRTFNLTKLLAHEFVHNLQNEAMFGYVLKTTLGKINWKLEGYAEYVAQDFQNDGLLLSKINRLEVELAKAHLGIPVFDLEDGTKQSLAYFKYALIVQYMQEYKGLSFHQICDDPKSLDQMFAEMINWKDLQTESQ